MARKEKPAAGKPPSAEGRPAPAGKSAPAGGKKLLEAARRHQDALQAQGLSATVLDRYETSLRGLESKAPNAAAQTLVKELQRAAGEVQAAIRREFPGNGSFQSVFKADEPMPSEPRAVLALGRLVVKEAPDYSQNLIKHGINAATLGHLRSLCDQLEQELGGADPQADSRQLETQIHDAARRAFEGKPELGQFDGR